MVAVRVALRWLRLVSWGAWVGGFVVYGGVVVPILHTELDSLQAGGITRLVTLSLNWIGAAALACWIVADAIDRPRLPRLAFALLAGSLAVSIVLLAAQVLLHEPMARMVDSGSMDHFYPYHRLYLIASTAQWLANMIVPACWATAWTAQPPTGDPP